eukprot:sb/3470575/
MISTPITGLQKGHMYVAIFEQALLYKWGHCSGQFRVQLGSQVHFSPMIPLPSKYPSMSPWYTVRVGYYIATSSKLTLKISAVRGHQCKNPHGEERSFTDLAIDNVHFENMGPLPPDGAPGLRHPAMYGGGYTGYTSKTVQKVYPSGTPRQTSGGMSRTSGSSSGSSMTIVYETIHAEGQAVPVSHGITKVKSGSNKFQGRKG